MKNNQTELANVPAETAGESLYEWVRALVSSVMAVVLIFTFAVRLIGVDGHSMVPTLQDGDRLAVAVGVLAGKYRTGDIVVLRKQSFLDEPIVKRVIAMRRPGAWRAAASMCISPC